MRHQVGVEQLVVSVTTVELKGIVPVQEVNLSLFCK